MVDSGAAGNVMPRSMFPERSKNGKGMENRSKGPGGSTSRILGSKLFPSGPLRDLCPRARGMFADVRRPLVSASHIIQAGNDLFIGKNEAYIMNRKKKDKSVLRKEGNVYVLDLFVEVPACTAAPIKYKPMKVDAINQVADGRERRKRVTLDCSKPTFWRQDE